MHNESTAVGAAERARCGRSRTTSHARKLAAGARLRDRRRAKITHASRPHGGWSGVPQAYLEALGSQTDLQWSFHEFHAELRARFVSLLADSPDLVQRRQAEKMRLCCIAGGFSLNEDTGEVRPYLSRCKVRVCPLCQKARAANVARQVNILICSMKEPAHIVLTVKSHPGPLAPQVIHLRESFTKLRRTKLWRDNVKSGCYTIEITVNRKTKEWHPHLHVIADTPYIPQRLLRSAWHRITGDSHVVWISRVRSHDAAAWEVAKYAGKPARVDELADEQLLEFASTCHRQRMMQAFGKRPAAALHDVDCTDTDNSEPYTISAGKIRQLAAAGHKWPATFAILAARRWPMFQSYFLRAAPQLAAQLDPTTDPPSIHDLLDNLPPGRAPPPCHPPDTTQLDQALAECLRNIRTADDSGAYAAPPSRSQRHPVRLFGQNLSHTTGAYNDH